MSRGRMVLRGGAFVVGVVRERRRIAKGSGKGLGRVDARTGDAASLRQTVVLMGAREAVPWVLARIPALRKESGPRSGPEEQAEVREEMERAYRQHAEDPAARDEEIARIYREHKVGSGRRTLPALARTAVSMAVVRCPVPGMSERRTVIDLLAGTKAAPKEPSRLSRLWRAVRRR